MGPRGVFAGFAALGLLVAIDAGLDSEAWIGWWVSATVGAVGLFAATFRFGTPPALNSPRVTGWGVPLALGIVPLLELLEEGKLVVVGSLAGYMLALAVHRPWRARVKVGSKFTLRERSVIWCLTLVVVIASGVSGVYLFGGVVDAVFLPVLLGGGTFLATRKAAREMAKARTG